VRCICLTRKSAQETTQTPDTSWDTAYWTAWRRRLATPRGAWKLKRYGRWVYTIDARDSSRHHTCHPSSCDQPAGQICATDLRDSFARPLARRDFRKKRPSRAYTSLRETRPVWYVMEGERAAQAVRRRATDSAYRDGAIARKTSSARAAVRAVRPARSMNPTTASAWDR
jgi:hypothetical protein